MSPRQGIRSSNCSTVVIPALVTINDVGRVLPSLGATSAPDDETSNLCATACGRMRQPSETQSG
jgi:hypothetical protein